MLGGHAPVPALCQLYLSEVYSDLFQAGVPKQDE